MLSGAMRKDEHHVDPQQPNNHGLDLELLERGLGDAENDDLEDSEDDASSEDKDLFRDALQNYRAESFQWAERRSSTMPVPKTSPALPWWQRVPAPAFAAAVLTLLVSAAAVQHHIRHTAADETAAFVQPSSQILASDNQLLSSVYAALDQDPAPTEQDLGLSMPLAHRAKHLTLTASNDYAH